MELEKPFVVAKTQSSEELYIKSFLNENNIKVKCEVKISSLKNDTKAFRTADFYLPNLDIYLEYYGLYNSNKEIRSAYDAKTQVYLKNNIPTVFIYPHELGFLEYAFHSKVVKLLRLKKFKRSTKFFRYKVNRMWQNETSANLGLMVLTFILCLVFFFEDTGLNKDFAEKLGGGCFGLFAMSFISVFHNFYNYLIKNR